jgi:hypothetical protein
VTSKVLEQFTNLTKKSIQQHISDLITERLKTALTKEDEAVKEKMRATSKHLQIQGRSAKLIFILQMPRNIVSLFKRFGRRVFQNRTSSSCKTYN